MITYTRQCRVSASRFALRSDCGGMAARGGCANSESDSFLPPPAAPFRSWALSHVVSKRSVQGTGPELRDLTKLNCYDLL